MIVTDPFIDPSARKRAHVRPAKLFLLIAPLIFAAYALLTPPFETPDEHQHLFRAWQLSQLHLFGERRGEKSGGMLPNGLGRSAQAELGLIEPHSATLRRVVKRHFGTNVIRSTALNTDQQPQFFNFSGSVIYSPVGYVPQIGAIWIGNAVSLSVEQIVLLARLLNAALSILLLYFAIRITPVGALVMLWVGLLPMTASAAAAAGQDGLEIGGACLLASLGLRAALNGRWKLSELLMSTILTISLALSKGLYLAIGMAGGQPFLRRQFEWPRLVVTLLMCLVAAALAAWWMHAVSGLLVPAREGVAPASERIAVWVRHPAEFPMLFWRTYVVNGVPLFDTLFTFGWLNVGPVRSAELLSLGACVLVLLAGDPEAAELNWQTRLWLLLIGIVIVILMTVAIYLYFTHASDTFAQGLQGRYFIPIVPLLLLSVLPKRYTDVPYGIFIALLMVAANLLALNAIVSAYYH